MEANNTLIQHNSETAFIHVPNEQTYRASGFEYACLKMFFNGQLCEVTVADKAGYFAEPNKTYQLLGASAMLTADGTGMNHVLRVNAKQLLIDTNFGCFILRAIKDTDKKVYGVNNYKGLFLEKLSD